MENVKVLEDKKMATINQIKSNYMVINQKTKKYPEIDLTFSDGNTVKKADEYKYLGTLLEKSGKCNRNIIERKKNCERAFPKIEQMASKEKVGRISVSLKIEQYKIII